MTLHFSQGGIQIDQGLNLTVTVIDASIDYDINGLDTYTGGTIVASVGGKSVTKAKINDVVTLTATPGSDYLLSSLSVVDDNGNPVGVKWEGSFDNTATFTMPYSAVTVNYSIQPADWATESPGTAAQPFMIYNKDQLDMLAQRIAEKGDDSTESLRKQMTPVLIEIFRQANALVRIAPDESIRQFIQNICGVINHYKQVAASGASHGKDEPEPTPVDPDVTPVEPDAQAVDAPEA